MEKSQNFSKIFSRIFAVKIAIFQPNQQHKVFQTFNIKQNKYYKNKNRRGELDWSGFLNENGSVFQNFDGLDDFFLFERRHNT